MLIDIDETQLRTAEQLQKFLRATPEVRFTAPPAGSAAIRQRHHQRQGQGHQALSPPGCKATAGSPQAALRQGLAQLKDGVTLAALQALADAQTDLAAAQDMQRTKAELPG